MATTTNQYTGDGSTTSFSFTFPYLKEDDVVVRVDNVVKTKTTDYTFPNASTVEFTTAPADNTKITISRSTDVENVTSTFFAGSAIRAEDLNDNFKQNFYLLQEFNNDSLDSTDGGTVIGDVTFTGDVNVTTDPTQDTDVVNLRTLNKKVENVPQINPESPPYSRESFTATAGQTVFNTTKQFTIGREEVYLNGVLLEPTDDYTTPSTSRVTLVQGALADDVLEVVCLNYTIDAQGVDASVFSYTHTGTGGTERTIESRLEDFVSVKDFGAVGNGTEDDTAEFQNAKTALETQVNGIIVATNGEYSTTGSIWDDNVEPTNMAMTRPSVFGIFEGTDSNPDEDDKNPALWVQKYTKYDSDGDRFNHTAGGVFGEVNVLGTGQTGANDTEGTWIGVLGNCVIKGENQGSASSPDYDAFGSSIGVAGFARVTGYPGDGNIACGVWGYTQGPTLDATTQNNLPSTNWSLVGFEANIQINHQDIGEQSVLVGKGSSVGVLNFNYRTPNTGVKDWTFGMVLNGNPDDDDYTSTDIDNWNGFYCGILVDKIKKKGIRFGQYMKTGSYGIYFPDTYIGSEEPAAAIYLGNSKLAMGQYTGSTFNNGDFWHNGGQLYWRYGGVTLRSLTHNQSTGSVLTSTSIDFQTNGASTQFAIGNVANVVNYLKVNGAATGNTPALAVEGSDSNVSLELRTKGTGTLKVVGSSSTQFAVGSVASSVNYVTMFGAAASATPAIAAVGSDTNVDIELRPKGSGYVWVGDFTSGSDASITGYIEVKDSTGVVRKIATIA